MTGVFGFLKAILAPGTLQLVTIGQAPAETIGQAFCPLKAANHGGNIDMAVRSTHGLRALMHTVWRVLFLERFGSCGFYMIIHFA